ncbi:MAG: di-heme oxidoredictase family protein, partial [Planctomycetota bacterium]
VPAQRDPENAAVHRGDALFHRMGCVACHVPTQKTGAAAVVDGIAEVTFRPYTDLLLHDLGPELADGTRPGDAGTSEWRTPPLWGIGLFETVNGHTRYLHDGRARDLSEAVLWHGGEAQAAREAFRCAPPADRADLLAFLQSL